MSSKIKATRANREELKDAFGSSFTSTMAEQYGRMSEDEQEEVRGMSESEAKKTLREKARKDRKKVEEAVKNAEPGWKEEQRNSPPKAEKPRTFIGPGVVDTGRGSVLIGGFNATEDTGTTPDAEPFEGASAIAVVVVVNGEFMTGDFYIDGSLTAI